MLSSQLAVSCWPPLSTSSSRRVVGRIAHKYVSEGHLVAVRVAHVNSANQSITNRKAFNRKFSCRHLKFASGGDYKCSSDIPGGFVSMAGHSDSVVGQSNSMADHSDREEGDTEGLVPQGDAHSLEVMEPQPEVASTSGSTWIASLLKNWKVEGTKGRLAGLLLGQALSLLVTATGLTSALLAQKGVNIPTTQGWLNYLLLTLVYGGMMLRREKRPQAPLYVYALLGLIDVEANYLVVRAYQYTSITSVMLLDCFTIPCVLLLTRLILKTRYQARHFLGVLLCLSGLVMLVLSDVHSADRGGGSAVLVGDFLVLAAATLYAGSNVGEEALVEQVDRTELLAMVGAYGLAWNTLQLLLLERRELSMTRWSAATIAPFGGFSVALFAFYSLVPFMLQTSGSALFNLSLLTSDMWAVAIRALVFKQPVDWLYFVAFFAVSIGLVMYTRGEDEEEKEPGLAATSKYLRLDTYRKGDHGLREGVAKEKSVDTEDPGQATTSAEC